MSQHPGLGSYRQTALPLVQMRQQCLKLGCELTKACLIIDLVAGRGELTDVVWERIEPLLPQVD
ncbi:hypothetical protein ACIQOV_25760, partial [Kitasatospora sp. NPDC091257]|uniref:hypothetical protein n=1 Tax=Kitasatospora sp. NPDC091257 TaxID=3364084 RepID=UPI003812D601